MTKNDHKGAPAQEAALMAAMADLRAAAPDPDEAYMARVLSDGFAVQDEILAQRSADARARPGQNEPNLQGWRGVFAALGGWPAMTGLGAAAVTGLWIGAMPPEALSSVTYAALEGDITLALEPDLGIELFPVEEN